MAVTMVVDGNNLVMRSIHAMRGHQTALSSHGVNTGPLLVFARMFDRYVATVQPDRLVVCWDAAGPSWRRLVDETYKAHRPEAPEDEDREKHDSFRLVKEWLALNNVFTYLQRSFEADDLIAAFVGAEINIGNEVWIVSGDKDLLQLVEDGKVQQIRPTSGMTPEQETWDESRVLDRFGVSRDLLTLVNVLVGDQSDNIPGLTGIGPKRAATLVKASQGDVEALVENERCREFKDRIYSNLSLMDLRNPPLRPVHFSLPEFRPTSHDSIGWQALQGFLREYQLASLLEMVIGWRGD